MILLVIQVKVIFDYNLSTAPRFSTYLESLKVKPN